jgi:hypothetical protein
MHPTATALHAVHCTCYGVRLRAASNMAPYAILMVMWLYSRVHVTLLGQHVNIMRLGSMRTRVSDY